MQELNTQMQAMLLAEIEKTAQQATEEKQLLETEVSELRVRLQSSEERAEAMATQYWWKTQLKHISRESALEKEATERQEEAVTLRQEVASLKRKLENLEKERKDVLHERELNQQQMRDVKRKNEMCAPERPNHQERTQQLDVEKEIKQEKLEHGTAALKKGRGSALSAALSKCKIAKVCLQKGLAFLKGESGIQAGTGIDLQSTPESLSYSSASSHEEQDAEAEVERLIGGSGTILEPEQPPASLEKEKRESPEVSTEPRRSGEQDVEAQVEQLFRGSGTSLEPKQLAASSEEEKKESPELSTEPRRNGKQVEPERRRIRTFRRVFLPDYITFPVHESAHQNRSTFEMEESSSSYGEQQPSC
nr:ELKS/Rab6-interacting/CAST family member 1 isoform X3 [Taeniopygia guttata]